MLSKGFQDLLWKAEEEELVELASIKAIPLGTEETGWAIDTGSLQNNAGIRRFAAGVLLTSDFNFIDEERDALMRRMKEESDPETRVWLACALLKRRVLVDVDHLMEEQAVLNPHLRGLLATYKLPAHST